LHDGQCGHAFSAPGLPDETEGLPFPDVETRRLECFDDAFVGVEVGFEVADAQEGVFRRPFTSAVSGRSRLVSHHQAD